MIKVNLKPVMNQVQSFNLKDQVYNHLVDPKHSNTHRSIAGLLVMSFGVCVMSIECGGVMHMVVEYLGASIHGIGLIPIIDNFSNKKPDVRQQ